MMRSWTTSGLLQRWKMSAQNPRCLLRASSLGPYSSRRRSASSEVRPFAPVPRMASASAAGLAHNETRRRSFSACDWGITGRAWVMDAVSSVLGRCEPVVAEVNLRGRTASRYGATTVTAAPTRLTPAAPR